jgi:serine/threonine protein kinase
MVPPPDETPKSLGDGVTGSDVEPREDSSAQSLGDQSTTGDMGSSVSDLDALVGDFEDDQGEVIDLEARYEIQKTLGIGGMGEVVLAQDKRLNRQVAIKRLKQVLGASRRAAQRFLTEAQSVAALNHFNIVQIHDYGQAADGPFIVMEYVGGGSLAETLEGGALELERVIELGCQLCDAIGVAHQAGIIHRDIKPANVLMTAEGMPKLTDFGLARQETVDGGQTQAGAVLGTLDFMPPEQKVDATKKD